MRQPPRLNPVSRRPRRAARLRRAGCALAALFALALPLRSHAQYMSCEAFLGLDEAQRHVYVTGFVEGVTYTQLELSQLVTSQAKQKDLKDGEKLVLA